MAREFAPLPAAPSVVDALTAREQELEVERRKSFHQEKMAAIGAMVAGVLHEIGNPIAAIDGLARAMKDAQTSGSCSMGEGLCDPDLILRETARLQLFSRMIAGLAQTPSTEARLLSLNEIVQSALVLLHFDPHLRGVRIDIELEPQLPAITGIGDNLLQVVMNLLVNAGDAALRSAPARPLIHVRTTLDPAGVRLSIADCGSDMSDDSQQPALERPSGTEPAGSGLALCRTIVEQHGGKIQIRPMPGHGTCVTVRLAAAPATP